jgi:hypothetical protein
MRLTEWINDSHGENEGLDILLQVIRLLRESGKGQGIISPALYDIDSSNNVTYIEPDTQPASLEGNIEELYRAFKAPEGVLTGSGDIKSSSAEKRDVFSLGLLLYYLLNKEICYVNRQTGSFVNPFSKSRRRNSDPSAAMAPDSMPTSLLMQRMTSYEPDSRPYLKDVLCILQSNVCKFAIIPENIQTGERYTQISRSFTSSESYKFVPEDEYVFNSATITPLSNEPLTIPFRLVFKQYILEVAYGCDGRWHNTQKKAEVRDIALISPQMAMSVPKSTAALHYCDTVYGIKSDALFCETDGYTYEMGFYEFNPENSANKEIDIVREGSIAVPERLEARILSILREREKTIYDLFCVAVYGNISAEVIKAVNDMVPEAIRIYQLSDEEILKGAAIYLRKNNTSKKEETHEV